MKTELSEVWQQCLDLLERQTSKTAVENWLRNTRPVAVVEDTIIIGVQGEFAKDRMESRYGALLRQALRDLTKRNMQLKFVANPNVIEELPIGPADGLTEAEQPPPAADDYSNGSGRLLGYINPKYTFETFVVGNSNRFAHAAALAVAEAPARTYNPLFIYGGVGLGKTHLMHAIGHYVMKHNPTARVAYVSTETFTNEFISAIQKGSTTAFQNRYRKVDVLLIDDIQFLAGKEATQEEFYHTFNAIREANKQIVISSDRPPKEIPTLEDRLRSRFEWGLICDIQPPDLETRTAILRKKALNEELHVPDEVTNYIATNIETNIRELEGALTRVVAYANMLNSPLTYELAVHALKDILPPHRPKQITIQTIKQVVADHYNIRMQDFEVRNRSRSVAYPRQIAMYLSRELTDASLPKIGEEFGGRDHTTVIHACDKIAEDIKNDAAFAQTIEELIARIRAE
ncbi:chromosomal replication initiator protein [Symbiobacterium terraclitae]|uniref:Chromosomal replication initiator protein DnaA n=1 Tax=Symbiobacterium terraclitae TaxID=557451 RepID=A0ABS4JVG7_9FIRM|nr:chromosomal replication initiator protein DnaA [Symbiobacterium terraclitae]MBP2019503.1 chromosomal replication initiator protein [Symbiobacterium terraclitae]